MAGRELIVDDDYCKALGQYFLKHGANLDNDVDEYIIAMESLKEAGIMNGDAAKALDAYIQYSRKLDNIIYSISSEAYMLAHNFVSAIDSADQYLF